jgi:DNA-binding NtrC family response regulator
MAKLTGKILIIDDEPDLLEVLASFLEPHFTTVSMATDGKSGYELHKLKRFDVIISDLRMPEMTGQQLLQKLRAEQDETPFIILTGFADLEATTLALRLGAFDFFTKPFDQNVIVARTREAFEMRQLIRRSEEDVKEMIARGELNSSVSPEALLAAKHLAFLRRVNEHRNRADSDASTI